MDAIKEFASFDEALEYVKKMKGWDAYVESSVGAFDPTVFWVIRCNGHKYVRVSGFVE